MSKKNKHNSHDDWDYEWSDEAREEEHRRIREQQRRASREQKSKYTQYDWMDEN